MSSARICLLLGAILITRASGDILKDLLPQDIKLCKPEEAGYTSCLSNALQESWKIFVRGIPSLSLPVLDPFELGKVENSILSGPFKGNVILYNVKMYGLLNTQFLSVLPKLLEDGMKLDMDIEIPDLIIKSDYKFEGGIEGFKVSGKGFFNITMSKLHAPWSLEGRVENNTWLVEHFNVNPEITGLKIYLNDQLDENIIINEATVNIFNQYWQVLFKGVRPIINTVANPITHFLNRGILSNFRFPKLPLFN